jgi:hypothetical protein
METLDKDHFLTIVAKDAVVRTHGRAVARWPTANFWTLISTVKSSIKDEQIPQLMASYDIEELTVNELGSLL